MADPLEGINIDAGYRQGRYHTHQLRRALAQGLCL
jgi:hypothetical protein